MVSSGERESVEWRGTVGDTPEETRSYWSDDGGCCQSAVRVPPRCHTGMSVSRPSRELWYSTDRAMFDGIQDKRPTFE